MSFDINKPIDFVMIWVDGNDPEWRKEKALYDGKTITASNSEVRFRDWDNLQYWFRGVEKFAPWVNKIHFVTWGHLPPWLDTSNPKINVVKHTDYIPEEYLPTFSSHTIELNLHRIEGLAEQFVYFNDDMFITAPVKPEDFFKNGKPCDIAALDCIFFGKDSAGPFNGSDITVINSHFKKKRILKRDWRKWYNMKNGVRNVVKTVLLYPWPWFPGLLYQHACNSFLKSTFEKVWAKEFELLDETCSHRFRKSGDLNQWVMKFWQLAEGNFEVRREKFAYCYHVKESNFKALLEDIPSGRHSLLCVNDTAKTKHFNKKKAQLKEVLEAFFYEVSSFEKEEYYASAHGEEEILTEQITPEVAKANHRRQILLEGIDYFTSVLEQASKQISGKLSKSRQLFVLENLLKFIKVPTAPEELLSKEEAQRYFSLFMKVVSLIDEDVIIALDASAYYKLFVSQLKNQAKPNLYYEEDNLFVGYSEENKYSVLKNGLSLRKITVNNNNLYIEGCFKLYNAHIDDAQIIVLINGEYTSSQKVERDDVRVFMGIDVQKKLGFEVNVPLDDINNGRVSFILKLGETETVINKINFENTVALNNKMSKAYYINDGWKITSDGSEIKVKKARGTTKLFSEISFLAQILKRNKNGGKKAFLVRLALPVMKVFKKKPILIVEGINETSVSLFSYLRRICDDAKVVLVVPERYNDDGSLSAIGPIVYKESRKYKSLVLLSDRIFCKIPEGQEYNPFRKRYGFYKDILTDKKVVCLEDLENINNEEEYFASIL